MISPLAYLAMLGAIVGWGFSTSFTEFSFQYVSPLTSLFFRFFFTSLLLSPLLLKRGKEIRWLLGKRITWIVGLSESFGLIFQYLAISFDVSAGLASLLSLLFLVMVPFLSFRYLDEPIRGKHMIAVLISLVGVLLIAVDGDISNLFSAQIIGVVLLIISAFSYAVYIVSTSKLTTHELPQTDTFSLFYSIMVIISIVTFPFAVTEGLQIPTAQGLMWIIYLVLVSTVFAFVCYFYALKYIPANLASILLLGQLFVPFYIDIAYVGRVYSLWIYAGIVVMLAAMIMAISSSET